MDYQQTETHHGSKPRSLHQPCEDCGSSDALTEYDDGHSYCFSCEAYKAPSSFSDSGTNAASEFTYEYLSLWGITEKAFKSYDVKTKIDTAGSPVSVGFRYSNGDYQVRLLAKKEFYWVKKGSTQKPGLFGKDKFASGSHKYVVITEGAKDALSLWQVVQVPCVSVVSASSALSDCTVDRSYLDSYERIYLAFDSDAPGREATARVAKLFSPDKVWHVKFSNRKDANEYVQAQEEETLRNIFWNAKRYVPESIISTQEEFDGILSEEPKVGIAYPFSQITKKTKGIRLGESILITAPEGVGKTEMMHAIEHSILAHTDSNLGAFFFEELPRRHLQALAGIHLKAPVHLPDSGYSVDEVRTALREVLKRDERLFIHRYFGDVDPEILLDNIRYLVVGRGCSYILIDHITMVVSGSSSEDERRKLDYISTKLEMLVKELNFALIIVSHVNDFGQTRGSRYISKIADIRIDVSRDLLSTDPVVQRTISLVISKNRPAWETGNAGSYLFDPMTNSYTETNDVRYSSSEEAIPFINSPSLQKWNGMDYPKHAVAA